MAVYWRVSESTPILTGHWVCRKSIMVNDCCHAPQEVTKVSRTTISWRDSQNRSGTCGKSSIEFFADTEQEAQAVYALLRAKHDAIDDAVKRISAEFGKRIEAIAPGSSYGL
jgi:hypothetical protein